ncbi:spermidine/putrescine ABC transporter ATPase [Actibacterium atlanticum]|uniref:Spermidine/putrescine import ATP-binding protein PotA n=1 Tax=Actibacterium atlanticum TaxID=1461693 RepID=A0A058ZMQ5_9RHOB|nr:ABC transporter ATP-binding protein [Actibacterium atlanticum]KCV82808.1 spermidine/putrescine ABC transporter ATPase [Actibacterium atlanticum]
MSDAPIISIHDVSKYFGNFTALEGINIDIMPGEIFALLGPSGCGKSTLLRIIAGLETASSGVVQIGGEDMTDIPANKRPVNMVFQSYAVFPHMTVAENVAYGLKLEKLPKSEIGPKVQEALEQVHLAPFANRKPDQLSGGQRQRVALARALVKRPRVLLLDEPLSALDAKLRDAMRLELVKLQETVGVSFVMVTHDQSEALAMADRVAVLDAGRLRQLGTPAELYKAPVDRFVADFIGSINMFDVTGVEDGALLSDVLPPVALPPAQGEKQTLAVRPERVRVGPDAPEGAIAVNGRLGDVAFQGMNSIVEVRVEGHPSITALVTEADADQLMKTAFGSDICAWWRPEDMLVLPDSAL